MPEARDRMARGGGAVGELTGGFFISRVLSPGAMAVAAARPRRVRILSAEDSKENNPFLRSGRHRKSPLPSWYPRTPLRDITAIVNALEMRRARIRAARAQQRNDDAEVTPELPHLESPSPQESIPPTQGCSSDVSDTAPVSTSATGISSTPSSTQYQLPTSSTPAAHSPAMQTSSASADLTPSGSKPAEPLQMLCSSMDKIEEAVEQYLKRTPNVPTKKTAQRTLMSMR